MATYTKTILSGSTDGRGIKVAANSTPGTLIHTGPTSTAELHEVWLWVANSDSTNRKVTVQWGGTTSPDDLIEVTVAPECGLFALVPGLVIKGNATPLEVRVFCESLNVVVVTGFVNVIA